jgi:hypothetical protein
LNRFGATILKSNNKGSKNYEETNRRIIMSAPKIAGLLGIAGLSGVLVSVILGKLPGADYLLDAAFVCLGLAAIVVISHILIGLWTDFTSSA